MTADQLLRRIDDSIVKVNKNQDPTTQFAKWVESISDRLNPDELKQAVQVGSLIRESCGIAIPWLGPAEVTELLRDGRRVE